MTHQQMMTIPRLHVQVMFDALVHSLDFGSGFLDTEEVEALRATAMALGIPPHVATPSEFMTQYQHPFFRWSGGDYCFAGTWSRRCNAAPDDPIHNVSAEEDSNVK